MSKTTVVTVRVPIETKAALEKAAQDDRRTVSQYASFVIEDHLREKGFLAKP